MEKQKIEYDFRNNAPKKASNTLSFSAKKKIEENLLPECVVGGINAAHVVITWPMSPNTGIGTGQILLFRSHPLPNTHLHVLLEHLMVVEQACRDFTSDNPLPALALAMMGLSNSSPTCTAIDGIHTAATVRMNNQSLIGRLSVMANAIGATAKYIPHAACSPDKIESSIRALGHVALPAALLACHGYSYESGASILSEYSSGIPASVRMDGITTNTQAIVVVSISGPQWVAFGGRISLASYGTKERRSKLARAFGDDERRLSRGGWTLRPVDRDQREDKNTIYSTRTLADLHEVMILDQTMEVIVGDNEEEEF